MLLLFPSQKFSIIAVCDMWVSHAALNCPFNDFIPPQCSSECDLVIFSFCHPQILKTVVVLALKCHVKNHVSGDLDPGFRPIISRPRLFWASSWWRWNGRRMYRASQPTHYSVQGGSIFTFPEYSLQMKNDLKNLGHKL